MPEDKGKAEFQENQNHLGKIRYSYLYICVQGACCQAVMESKATHASMERRDQANKTAVSKAEVYIHIKSHIPGPLL